MKRMIMDFIDLKRTDSVNRTLIEDFAIDLFVYSLKVFRTLCASMAVHINFAA